MRTASHIAAALSAATGRSMRSNDWLLVGARSAYRGGSSSFKRPDSGGFRLKPE